MYWLQLRWIVCSQDWNNDGNRIEPTGHTLLSLFGRFGFEVVSGFTIILLLTVQSVCLFVTMIFAFGRTTKCFDFVLPFHSLYVSFFWRGYSSGG